MDAVAIAAKQHLWKEQLFNTWETKLVLLLLLESYYYAKKSQKEPAIQLALDSQEFEITSLKIRTPFFWPWHATNS